MKNLFSLVFITVFFLVTSAFADQHKTSATKAAAPEAPLHIDKKSRHTHVNAPIKSPSKTAQAKTPAKSKDIPEKPIEQQIKDADMSDLDQE